MHASHSKVDSSSCSPQRESEGHLRAGLHIGRQSHRHRTVRQGEFRRSPPTVQNYEVCVLLPTPVRCIRPRPAVLADGCMIGGLSDWQHLFHQIRRDPLLDPAMALFQDVVQVLDRPMATSLPHHSLLFRFINGGSVKGGFVRVDDPWLRMRDISQGLGKQFFGGVCGAEDEYLPGRERPCDGASTVLSTHQNAARMPPDWTFVGLLAGLCAESASDLGAPRGQTPMLAYNSNWKTSQRWPD